MEHRDAGLPSIGQNVRAARRSRGMSLETLAGLTGHSKGWLRKAENGHARLERRQDIATIAEALAVSADGLLGDPAPDIRPHGQMYDLKPLQSALLDLSLEDPPDMAARPVSVLRDEVRQADLSLRAAGHATVIRPLGSAISELCVHSPTTANSNGPPAHPTAPTAASPSPTSPPPSSAPSPESSTPPATHDLAGQEGLQTSRWPMA
jgi:transcriptional regulator with XRE-family HTH domain